mmetsp:Transcript_47372/g.120910  ORF Transcript_47372/g.120910 Transcript_47372/m.120910 type:complete len:218 (+) Transcript_47372:305-958(+)
MTTRLLRARMEAWHSTSVALSVMSATTPVGISSSPPIIRASSTVGVPYVSCCTSFRCPTTTSCPTARLLPGATTCHGPASVTTLTSRSKTATSCAVGAIGPARTTSSENNDSAWSGTPSRSPRHCAEGCMRLQVSCARSARWTLRRSTAAWMRIAILLGEAAKPSWMARHSFRHMRISLLEPSDRQQPSSMRHATPHTVCRPPMPSVALRCSIDAST